MKHTLRGHSYTRETLDYSVNSKGNSFVSEIAADTFNAILSSAKSGRNARVFLRNLRNSNSGIRVKICYLQYAYDSTNDEAILQKIKRTAISVPRDKVFLCLSLRD